MNLPNLSLLDSLRTTAFPLHFSGSLSLFTSAAGGRQKAASRPRGSCRHQNTILLNIQVPQLRHVKVWGKDAITKHWAAKECFEVWPLELLQEASGSEVCRLDCLWYFLDESLRTCLDMNRNMSTLNTHPAASLHPLFYPGSTESVAEIALTSHHSFMKLSWPLLNVGSWKALPRCALTEHLCGTWLHDRCELKCVQGFLDGIGSSAQVAVGCLCLICALVCVCLFVWVSVWASALRYQRSDRIYK